jgi:Ca2+-binding RTX toxin-like protein
MAQLKAVFYGEDGNDYLTGSLNNDLLVGGAGNDQLLASDGNDVLWGDQEGLTWAQRSGDNSAGSTDGNDVLEGGQGNDFIFGGGGNDTLNGLEGDDYLHGGYGNDNLTGDEGNDLLRGGDGNDQLVGDYGNDVLLAGLGDDFVYGGYDKDFVFAGGGSDRNFEVNDNGEDINVMENQFLDFDAINPSYNPANTATYFGPNDASLLALMTNWSGPGSFTTRAANAQSTLAAGASSDGAFDYLVGNMTTLDYSIVAAIGQYTYSNGDTIDTVA